MGPSRPAPTIAITRTRAANPLIVKKWDERDVPRGGEHVSLHATRESGFRWLSRSLPESGTHLKMWLAEATQTNAGLLGKGWSGGSHHPDVLRDLSAPCASGTFEVPLS